MEAKIIKIFIRKKVGKAKGVKPIQNISKVMDIISTPKNPRHKLLLAVGFITGYRISDILTMRVRDLKGKEIILTERKTGKERRVKISEPLREYISEAFKAIGKLSDNDYIFTSQKSKDNPMKREYANHIVKEACKKVGITERVGTHTMRKTASCIIRDSHPDKVVAAQKFLNHETIEETYTYLHMDDSYMDDAMDMASDVWKRAKKNK